MATIQLCHLDNLGLWNHCYSGTLWFPENDDWLPENSGLSSLSTLFLTPDCLLPNWPWKWTWSRRQGLSLSEHCHWVSMEALQLNPHISCKKQKGPTELLIVHNQCIDNADADACDADYSMAQVLVQQPLRMWFNCPRYPPSSLQLNSGTYFNSELTNECNMLRHIFPARIEHLWVSFKCTAPEENQLNQVPGGHHSISHAIPRLSHHMLLIAWEKSIALT